MKDVSVYDNMTRAEREVATFLKDLGIKWSYEHPVFVWDENKRPRVWAPDFFLSSIGIYIEVCGSKQFDYEYRRKIFENNGYYVIFLHLYKENRKWKYHLKKYIEKIVYYRNCTIQKIINNDN